MSPDMKEDLEIWLRSFSKAVRERDFTTGKGLFDERVMAFGTVCCRAENLQELFTNQWQLIWPNTKDFDFEYATARTTTDQNLAVIVTEWQSTGFDVAKKEFVRHGRATIVLQRAGSIWKAVHTHFSLTPPPNAIHAPLPCHPGQLSSASRVS